MSVLKRRVIINLGAAEWERIDSEQSLVSFLVVSVQSGTLGVWFGDNPSLVGQPDWTFASTVGYPVTVPLPTGLTTYTVAGVGGAVVGSLCLMAGSRGG